MRTSFREHPLAIWLGWTAVTTAAVVVCYFWVDRPVAVFFDTHLRQSLLWALLNTGVKGFGAVVVLALIVFAVGALVALFRRSVPHPLRLPMLCALSCLLSIAAETILKLLFGRSTPDPSYLEFHHYGFHFLRSRPLEWDSFPSGHAAAAFAIAGVFWVKRNVWRIPVMLLSIAVAGATVVINWHWVSDAIAGAWLGLWVGAATVALLQRQTAA